MSQLVVQLVGVLRSPAAAIAFLVGVNAIPLAGVLWLGWDAFTLLILYWVESGVVGIVNIFKIARAEGPTLGGTPARGSVGGVTWTWDWSVARPTAGTPGQVAAKGALIAFFCLHYGIFWVVHGVFVFTMPLFIGLARMLTPGGPAVPAVDVGGILLAVGALIVSHVASYWINFVGRGEYHNVSPMAQTFQPYGRVLVLHLVVVLGGTVILTLGQPIGLLVLLVVGKTILDVALHLRAHRRAQTTAVPAG